MTKKENLIERIYLNKKEFLSVERSVLIHEHLRRYGAIRRFCYGKVLDFACGCGYGSYLLAGNPDVEKVIGIDNNSEVINWAKKEFAHNKVEYIHGEIDKLNEKINTLVCLETLEHLPDIRPILKLVERCEVDNIVVSFPDKKTTHYNPYHLHDFTRQDLINIFKYHVVYHTIRFVDVQSLMFIRLPNKAPFDIFKNIKDLN